MHNVERTGISETAARDVLGDHKVEPGTVSSAEEIPRAQNDRAHAAVACLLDAPLDLDAHLALARGRLHRGALVKHRGHVAAVVPDAAREYQGRAAAFGRSDSRVGERQRVLLPFRDHGIEGVEHHVASVRRSDRFVAGHGFDGLDPARHGAGAAGPHQSLHRPAGVMERFSGRIAEPSGGPKHKNLIVHESVRRGWFNG